MRIPKRYGQSKTLTCPFCSRQATQKNPQGLDVCHKHIKQPLEEIKCTCGSWLEQRSGKFGPYFNCLNCGNMNFAKAMQIKEITMKNQPAPVSQEEMLEKKQKINKIEKKQPKEITITSDDVEYFD